MSAMPDTSVSPVGVGAACSDRDSIPRVEPIRAIQALQVAQVLTERKAARPAPV